VELLTARSHWHGYGRNGCKRSQTASRPTSSACTPSEWGSGPPPSWAPTHSGRGGMHSMENRDRIASPLRFVRKSTTMLPAEE
jgi:hypothetical protein